MKEPKIDERWSAGAFDTTKGILHGLLGVMGLILIAVSPLVSASTVGGPIPLGMAFGGAAFVAAWGYLEGKRTTYRKLQHKYHPAYLKAVAHLKNKHEELAQKLEAEKQTVRSEGYKQGLSQGYQKAQEEAEWG